MNNPDGSARRKASKLHDRLTPCECCRHLLSQRHHAIPFHEHGEHDVTLQLCANCHELYHLMWAAMGNKRRRVLCLLGHFVTQSGPHDYQFMWIHRQVKGYRDFASWLAGLNRLVIDEEEAIRGRLASGESIEEVAKSFTCKAADQTFHMRAEFLDEALQKLDSYRREKEPPAEIETPAAPPVA